MFERILVPTDGSDRAGVAVDHAADLAAHHGATLHVLNVADTGRESVLRVGGDVVDVLETEGEETVAEAADRARDRGAEVVTAVEQGPPHRTILDYCDVEAVDLAVLATHGRRGVERLLLGSVTERVLRHSDVPVLTVRPEERVAHPYESVMVATDGSDPAAAARDLGVRLAGAYGATLHALAVVDTSGLGVDVRSESMVEDWERRMERAVADVAERGQAEGLETVEAVEFGSPHRRIRKYADEDGADVVVMGTHGRTGIERYLLGSVTDRLVRTAPVPVLAVREADEE